MEKLKINCDQCNSDTVNGVVSHELGCPNSYAKYDAKAPKWVAIYECHSCGYDHAINAPCVMCCEEK